MNVTLFAERVFVYIIKNLKMTHSGDFPSGPVVKNPPSNARDVGSIPGRGTRFPHAPGATKPARHNYGAHTPWGLCATTREENTHTPQLERSLHNAMKDPACRN